MTTKETKIAEKHPLSGILLNQSTPTELKTLADKVGMDTSKLDIERVRLALQIKQLQELPQEYDHIDPHGFVKKVIVTPRNPDDAMQQGIVIGYNNAIARRYEKIYVAFNTEWALPVRAIHALDDMKFIDYSRVPRLANNKIAGVDDDTVYTKAADHHKHAVKAFNVQILPDYTEEELAELARQFNKQKAD